MLLYMCIVVATAFLSVMMVWYWDEPRGYTIRTLDDRKRVRDLRRVLSLWLKAEADAFELRDENARLRAQLEASRVRPEGPYR